MRPAKSPHRRKESCMPKIADVTIRKTILVSPHQETSSWLMAVGDTESSGFVKTKFEIALPASRPSRLSEDQAILLHCTYRQIIPNRPFSPLNMISSLPGEILEQIWAWVCRDEVVDVRCKHNGDDFRLIDTRDTIILRLFAGERATRLIHSHAVLNFDKLRSIDTLKRVFTGASRSKLRPFKRIRLGYYGLFYVMRSATDGPFDCVDELELQCCTRHWPPIEPEIPLDDDDVRDAGYNYDGRDGPLLLTRYCMARLKMADNAIVRLVRCFVGRDGCEKPTGITFQVKPRVVK